MINSDSLGIYSKLIDILQANKGFQKTHKITVPEAICAILKNP